MVSIAASLFFKACFSIGHRLPASCLSQSRTLAAQPSSRNQPRRFGGDAANGGYESRKAGCCNPRMINGRGPYLVQVFVLAPLVRLHLLLELCVTAFHLIPVHLALVQNVHLMRGHAGSHTSGQRSSQRLLSRSVLLSLLALHPNRITFFFFSSSARKRSSPDDDAGAFLALASFSAALAASLLLLSTWEKGNRMAL